MATEPATHQLIAELRRTLDHMNADLDRVEVLTSALYGFAQPVPDYEPNFQQFGCVELGAHGSGHGD